MANPKDKEQNSNAGVMGTDAYAAHDAHRANQDLSHERASTLDRMVMEAITRETAQLTAMFTAFLNERTAVNLLETLKVTSGAAGFKAMTPFDWTRDKTIYH